MYIKEKEKTIQTPGKGHKCSASEHRLYNKKQITKVVYSVKPALRLHSMS